MKGKRPSIIELHVGEILSHVKQLYYQLEMALAEYQAALEKPASKNKRLALVDDVKLGRERVITLQDELHGYRHELRRLDRAGRLRFRLRRASRHVQSRFTWPPMMSDTLH